MATREGTWLAAAALCLGLTGCGDRISWRHVWLNDPWEAQRTWARAWEDDDGTHTVRFGGCVTPRDQPDDPLGCQLCMDFRIDGYDGEAYVSMLDEAPTVSLVHAMTVPPYRGRDTPRCPDTETVEGGGFVSAIGNDVVIAQGPVSGGGVIVEFHDTGVASGHFSGVFRAVFATDTMTGITPQPVVEGPFAFRAVRVRPGPAPTEEEFWAESD